MGSGHQSHHDIVREQHETRKFVGETRFPKSKISEITDVLATDDISTRASIAHDRSRAAENLHLRVLHDESPHGHRGNPEEDAGENHGDYARYPAEDAQ